MNTKAHRALREKFIAEHYDHIERYAQVETKGRERLSCIENFINNVARPALKYGARTDSWQIWMTLRADFQRVRKQLAMGHGFELDFKAFRPHVVNKNAPDLNDAYGITDERRIELSAKLDAIVAELQQNGGWTSLHAIIDKIADICATREEFTWAMVTHIMWLAAKGLLTSNNPHDLLKRKIPPSINN